MTKQADKIKDRKWIFTLGLVLAALFVVAPRLLMMEMGHPVTTEPTLLDARFTLMDEDGHVVTQETYNGFYRLIFFGFTFCPVICPTEMQKMSDVLAGLDEAQRARLKPLFISVDPERDTPEALRIFTDNFDPAITGLTGTVAQVEAAEHAFKVYAKKVPQGDDYTMDHSAFLYLLGPDNKLLTLYGPDQTATQVLQDLHVRMTLLKP